MEKEIIITPEELYYLGKLLQAKYIDYAYIAAVENIDQNIGLFEMRTADSLIEKGLLSENINGTIEINHEAADLLKPVFFGQTESSVDVCKVKEGKSLRTVRFHFYEGRITEVSEEKGRFHLAMTDTAGIKETLRKMVFLNTASENTSAVKITKDNLDQVISLKKTVIGQSSVVEVYMVAEGGLFRENENGMFEPVEMEVFFSNADTIVAEV